MKKNRSFFKKAQAVVLVMALIASLAVPLQGMQVLADTNETETTTDGKIVAQNYDLSAAEKELIGSGLLVGGTHSYLVPDSDDGLISVDTDNKKITVGTYEGTTGYLWTAESVNIVVGTEVKETVALTNGEGTYTYDGNAFSVVANYALDIEVANATQTALLNAPSYLANGLANLEDLADVKSDLAIIEQAMPDMVLLATTGKQVEAFGQKPTVTFSTIEAKESTLALNAQMTANGGKVDFSKIIEEYEAAGSKVQYLIENGAEMKAKAEELKKHIDNILTADFWGLIGWMPEGNEYTNVLKTLRNAIKGDPDNAVVDGASEKLAAAIAGDWSVLEKTILKEGITADEYKDIDEKLAKIENFTNVLALEIKNPLRVSTATVQYNMSMFDVTVKVALNLTDTTKDEVAFYEYGSATTTVTLAENATKAEILAAVAESGIEASTKTAWGSAYVDGKFDVTTTKLPETLTSDIEYVITYAPKMYDVTFTYGSQGTVAYPYGYIVKLESHADELKAYDYTINENYYAQGSTYKVVGATEISRKEGKSYVSSNLYQIVADNYLEGKAEDILTSGALFGNEIVSVRYPDNTKGIVKLEDNVLTAVDYSASYENLSWKPYSYTLSNGNTYFFNGNNTVEINEYFDTVTVSYRLYLTNYDNGTVLDIANIPAVLSEEAKAQLDAFDVIAAQKGNLETLNRTMVNILAGLIENTTLSDDAAKDAALKASFAGVLDDIQANCMGATNLYLFDIVNEYSGSSNKLLYYYNNNATVRNEITKMADYMYAMLGDDDTLTADDKLAALEKLMRSLPSNIVSPDKVDEYVGKLTSLETTMTNVKNSLSAPNAIINLDSDKLGDLTLALQADGTVTKFDALSEGLNLEDSTIVVVASHKTAITVTLQIEGGKNTTITSATVANDTVADANFVNSIKNAIKAELAAQSINTKYYDTDYADSIFDALIGTKVGDITTTSYEFTWTYKSFGVEVPGTDTQYIYIKSKSITLPASTDAAYRYDYYINGVKVSGTSYTLSNDEFDMVVNGDFEVTRKEVYIIRENLVNYVNSLNDSIGNNQAVFALVEDKDGKFSIVLKIDASAPNGLMGAVQGMAMGMVQGAYPYVGINNDKFLADGSVYLQTMVDALLTSGFGSDELLNIVDANGNINNMPALDGNIISNKDMSAMGGKLMETTMQLGTTDADVTSLPLYVTLGAVNSDFVQIRNLFEDKLSSLISFEFDGAASVTLNLPDKAYEAFLAALLVTENLDIQDMNAVNGEIAVTFVNDMLLPLFKGDITVETFDNTLAKFGINLDLSSTKGAETLFSKIKSFYTDATFSYDEIGGTAAGNLSIESFVDSMNLGTLGNIIAEKQTGLDIGVRIALSDLAKDYEALYLDVDADGLTNKIGLTEDLAKKMSAIKGKSAIVLLDDVKADLTFNGAAVLNLNGHKLDGSITANATTVIIDSNIKTTRIGHVTGEVSGKATVVAGKFDKDVTDYIKAGFVQGSDGVVANKYYDIAKTENGDVIVSVNAALISTNEMPDFTSIAIDIACDLLFNGYTSNYLELDGNLIYDLTFDDVIGLYTSSDRLDTVIEEALAVIDSEQLTKFINTVLDDILDFAAISEAIEKNEPVLEYEIVTKPWAVEFEHVQNGDYITSNVVSGKNANEGMLKIYINGNEEDKALVADIFAELGETVDADINVNLAHGKDGKDIKVSASADADVRIDWSNPNYAVMFGTIIADGLNPAERAGLVEGINAYYETGDITKLRNAFNALKAEQLIKAVENVGVHDSFTDMVKALGLTDVVANDVVELEKLYDRIGKLAAFAVRKANLEGGSRTLGSFIDADGTYGASRANIERLYKKSLFRGYALEADIAITNAVLKIKLFEENTVVIDYTELNKQIEIAEALEENDYTEETWKVLADELAKAIEARKATTQAEVDAAAERLKNAIAALKLKAPVFVDGHGNPTFVESEKLAGSLVNVTDNMLVVDTQIAGLTVAEFKELLKLEANNADTIEVEFEGLTNSDLVANGSKLTATARREGVEEVDVVNYQIIVLGDINANGRIEVGDAVLISRMLVGEITFSDIQSMAADTNCNARTDIGDATRIASKMVDWENYATMLNAGSVVY